MKRSNHPPRKRFRVLVISEDYGAIDLVATDKNEAERLAMEDYLDKIHWQLEQGELRIDIVHEIVDDDIQFQAVNL